MAQKQTALLLICVAGKFMATSNSQRVWWRSCSWEYKKSMNFYKQLALSATDKISGDLNSVPGPAVDWKQDKEGTETMKWPTFHSQLSRWHCAQESPQFFTELTKYELGTECYSTGVCFVSYFTNSRRDPFKVCWLCDSIREGSLARIWADPFPVTHP